MAKVKETWRNGWNTEGGVRGSRKGSMLDTSSIVSVLSLSMGSERTVVYGGGERGECKVHS